MLACLASRAASPGSNTEETDGPWPPVNPDGGVAYFRFGEAAHQITMKCPAGEVVAGDCSSDEVCLHCALQLCAMLSQAMMDQQSCVSGLMYWQFTVECQDSGRISIGTCVQSNSCTQRRGVVDISEQQEPRMLQRKLPVVESSMVCPQRSQKSQISSRCPAPC